MTETNPATPVSQNDMQTFLRRVTPPRATLTWITAITLTLIAVVWLWLTPGGLLGKADAVGYAVCHRITVRSFLFPNGRQLPMCARCSGSFIGVLLGLLGPGLIFKQRHAGAFPPMKIVIVMLAASAWWAFDGANSFTHLLPAELPIPRLFEPNNILRVTTGMFHGITLGGLMLPLVNATLWADAVNEPIIKNFKQLGVLYGIGVVLILMVLSGLAIFLYPLAIVSAIGAVAILAATNTVMVATILRRENVAHTLGEALPLIFLGLAAALLMVGAIDAVRFAYFGSWEGLDISQFRQ